jgi:hypothetical protein
MMQDEKHANHIGASHLSPISLDIGDTPGVTMEIYLSKNI